SFGGVDQDDALATAVLMTELVQWGPLAEAAFTDGEDLRALRIGDCKADDLVAFFELDALHAGGVAAHRANLFFAEADALTRTCTDQQISGSVGHGGGEETIVLLDAHADDALF